MRERRILRQLASGRTHEHIAALDGIGLRTVKRTIPGLEQKLDATSLFSLGARAAELSLLK